MDIFQSIEPMLCTEASRKSAPFLISNYFPQFDWFYNNSVKIEWFHGTNTKGATVKSKPFLLSITLKKYSINKPVKADFTAILTILRNAEQCLEC